MTLDCYDFDAGQPRHFPAGNYYEQARAAVGEVEIDTMRLLWKCWLVFKRKRLDAWDNDDAEFVAWLTVKPKDDTVLNRVILWRWLVV